MKYSELKQFFQKFKHDHPKDDLTAHVIFTEDSFAKPYPLLSRTYSFTNNNKAFLSNMGGYSIFACCLDGTDQGIRLDWHMAEERNVNGWKVQDCYILEQMRDVAAIPHYIRTEQGGGAVCYFFGDTCIRARESKENGKIRLEPVAGDQTVCGEWVDLPIDRVYGYCTLLEQHLNRRAST